MSSGKYPLTIQKTGETVASYAGYLDSNHWKNKKIQYFKSVFSKTQIKRNLFKFKRVNIGNCQVCGVKDYALQIHHLSYKNLGNESEKDLRHLCRKCHELQHQKADEWPSRSLHEIFEITRKQHKKAEKKKTSKGVEKVRKHNKSVKNKKRKRRKLNKSQRRKIKRYAQDLGFKTKHDFNTLEEYQDYYHKKANEEQIQKEKRIRKQRYKALENPKELIYEIYGLESKPHFKNLTAEKRKLEQYKKDKEEFKLALQQTYDILNKKR